MKRPNKDNIKYQNYEGYLCVAGSERQDVGDKVILSHADALRILVYRKDSRIPLLHLAPATIEAFNARLDEILAEEKRLASRRLATTISHKLALGTIMVSHSNVKDPSTNEVRYFQIVELLPQSRVGFKEIKSEEIQFTGCKASIPLVGETFGRHYISHVTVDTIKIDDELFGSILEYKSVDIGEGVKVKVYEPQRYALFAN